MHHYNIYIYILVMAGVTYLIRMLPLVLFKNEIKSKYIKSFLFYVPYACLAAMTFPAILTSTAMIWSGIAGFLVALFMAYKKKSLIIVALSACLAVFIVERIPDCYHAIFKEETTKAEQVQSLAPSQIALDEKDLEIKKAKDLETNIEKNLEGKENKDNEIKDPNAIVSDKVYDIRVNNTTNTVTIYLDNQPIRVMLCSTGGATPSSGTYNIGYKSRWQALFGNVYGQYTTVITGNILFHTVPYERNEDPSSLETEEFDKLGTPASMGCVRLCVADAKWIYENCDSRTTVTFYESEDPGPLGKPEMVKIGSTPEVANAASWDPTDSDPANPWKKYTEYFGKAFDLEYYKNNTTELKNYEPNDDIIKAHWLTVGIPKGYASSENFNITYYKANYPELAKSLGDSNYNYVKKYNSSNSDLLITNEELNTSLITDYMSGLVQLLNRPKRK